MARKPSSLSGSTQFNSVLCFVYPKQQEPNKASEVLLQPIRKNQPPLGLLYRGLSLTLHPGSSRITKSGAEKLLLCAYLTSKNRDRALEQPETPLQRKALCTI